MFLSLSLSLSLSQDPDLFEQEDIDVRSLGLLPLTRTPCLSLSLSQDPDLFEQEDIDVRSLGLLVRVLQLACTPSLSLRTPTPLSRKTLT